MGSLEEDKLFEMVSDFIESDSSPPLFYPSSLNPSHYQSITSILQVLIKIIPINLHVSSYVFLFIFYGM